MGMVLCVGLLLTEVLVDAWSTWLDWVGGLRKSSLLLLSERMAKGLLEAKDER